MFLSDKKEENESKPVEEDLFQGEFESIFKGDEWGRNKEKEK
jgi:hypothetical protein